MTKQFDLFGIRIWLSVALTVVAMVAANSFVLSGTPQDGNSRSQERSADELRLDYARLNLALVETELKLAEQFNRELVASIPKTVVGEAKQNIIDMKQVSKAAMARLRSNLAIGRDQLDQAMSPSTGDPEQLRKRYAEEKIQLAKVNLDDLLAKKAIGQEVRDLEVTRLELKYKLARLKLELLGSPEHVLTLVDSLQRQIDRLSEEMIAQDQRITALEDR